MAPGWMTSARVYNTVVRPRWMQPDGFLLQYSRLKMWSGNWDTLHDSILVNLLGAGSMECVPPSLSVPFSLSLSHSLSLFLSVSYLFRLILPYLYPCCIPPIYLSISLPAYLSVCLSFSASASTSASTSAASRQVRVSRGSTPPSRRARLHCKHRLAKDFLRFAETSPGSDLDRQDGDDDWAQPHIF